MIFRKQNESIGHHGFTLLELLVVTAIIGILATLITPSYRYFVSKTQMTRSKAEIRALEKDIYAFALEKGSLPAQLTDIGRGTILDPWKRPYMYNPVPSRISVGLANTDFDLYSMGQDGATAAAFSDPASLDDIVRAGDGSYVGIANDY